GLHARSTSMISCFAHEPLFDARCCCAHHRERSSRGTAVQFLERNTRSVGAVEHEELAIGAVESRAPDLHLDAGQISEGMVTGTQHRPGLNTRTMNEHTRRREGSREEERP